MSSPGKIISQKMVLREFLNNQVSEIYNPNKTAYAPVIH